MTFVNIMKEKSLRKRVYFTVFVLAVTSLLTQIPVAGVNSDFLQYIFQGSTILDFMDSMSGGSLSYLSLASFGITTYITSIIVIQLMAVIFPSIDKIRKDGERGRKTMEKIEFTLAMGITFVSSLIFSLVYGANGLFEVYDAFHVVLAITCWMAGSFVIIFLAQQVETYGVGSGVTLVLGFNILSRVPSTIMSYYSTYANEMDARTMLLYVAGILLVLFVCFLIGVYLQCGILNVSIRQTKKEASLFNTDGYIPVHVNIANVLPVIYASTIMAIPTLIVSISGYNPEGTAASVYSVFDSANWYSPSEWYHVLGLIIYIVLILAFGFVASGLSYNSADITNNMRKNGDVIPYVQPGAETVQYLERRRRIMSCINVFFLLILTVLPDAICTRIGVSFPFIGTSMVIVIAMLFDTALRMRAVSIHNDKHFSLFREV